MAQQQITKKDIPLSLFTTNSAYGSPDGNDYGLVGQPRSRVILIQLYVGRPAFGRIMVQKNDGTSIVFGATKVGEPITWKFDQDVQFNSVKLYTKNRKLVGIYMRTTKDKNNEYSAFAGDYPRPSELEEHIIETGQSGELVGVFGNADVWVESLGLAMRK